MINESTTLSSPAFTKLEIKYIKIVKINTPISLNITIAISNLVTLVIE